MNNELTDLLALPPGASAQVCEQLEDRAPCPHCSVMRDDPIDLLAGLRRWTLQRATQQLHLSAPVRHLLGSAPVQPAWMARVVQEDRAALARTLSAVAVQGTAATCEFRLQLPEHGIRWLRLQSLASGQQPFAARLLTDITPRKLAARRERFNFGA